MATDTGHNVVGGGLLGAGAVAAAWLAAHLKGFRFRVTAGNQAEEKTEKEHPVPDSVRQYRTSQADLESALRDIKFAVARLEDVLMKADIPLIQQTQSLHGAEIRLLKENQVIVRESIAGLKRQDDEHAEKMDHLARQIRELKDHKKGSDSR